jgi:ribosome assembly protein YihI (activator of Der GTPase)
MMGKPSTEVSMTAENEYAELPPLRVRETVAEQMKRKGITSSTLADMRNDEIWETDEELAEFLEYLDAQRHGRRP